MHGSVGNEEWQIFKEVYQFFAAHCEPPACEDQEAVHWWQLTASSVTELASKWQGHPLMNNLLLGIYEYLDCKAKEKTKGVTGFVQEQ